MVALVFNGNPYNDSSTPPGNMGNGGHRENFFKMLQDFMADLSRLPQTTSTTSVAIGTGSKVFTLSMDVPFAIGGKVIAASVSNTANYMWGTVTAKSGVTLTIDVADASDTGGSGSHTDWLISVSGIKGPGSISVPVSIGNGGTGQTSAANAFAALKQAATDLATGVVELATQAEVDAGTDATRVLTPATAAGRYLADDAGTVDATNLASGAVTASKVASGFIVGRAYAETSALVTGTAIIPHDNTRPQISEGTLAIQLAYTPKASTNRLRITFNGYFTNDAGIELSFAVGLFRVGTNDCKKAVSNQITNFQKRDVTVIFEEVAGGVSEITFQIRFGPSTAAGSGIRMNAGAAGTQLFGGADIASLFIEDISA